MCIKLANLCFGRKRGCEVRQTKKRYIHRGSIRKQRITNM